MCVCVLELTQSYTTNLHRLSRELGLSVVGRRGWWLRQWSWRLYHLLSLLECGRIRVFLHLFKTKAKTSCAPKRQQKSQRGGREEEDVNHNVESLHSLGWLRRRRCPLWKDGGRWWWGYCGREPVGVIHVCGRQETELSCKRIHTRAQPTTLTHTHLLVHTHTHD